jgi:hypothetical protein
MPKISFADDAIGEVVSGLKRETLRVGEDFLVGSVVEFVRQNGDHVGFLKILERTEVLFGDLSERDVRTHHSRSLDHLKSRLLSFYPQLAANSKLTRYRFEFATKA